MADPISIIGLLGTAASLTKTILRYASSVKDVPSELESLRLELSNLHKMLDKLIKSEGSEDSRQDNTDIVTLHNAAEVGFVPRTFPSSQTL